MNFPGLFDGYKDRGRYPLLMLMPILVLLGLVARLLFLEIFLQVPIPIKPLDSQKTTTDLYLFWNQVKGAGITYDVEVDGESPYFNDLLYSWTDLEKNKVKIRSAFPGGQTRYWRVRAVRAGKPGNWSRAISFLPQAQVPLPEQPGLKLLSARQVAEGIEVEGETDLPPGTIYYLHLVDPRHRKSLYRLRYRVQGGRFRKILRPSFKPGSPGRYLIRAATYPCQNYPVSEYLGERGERLRQGKLKSGQLLAGLGIYIDLSVGTPSGSSFPGRRRFRDYFIDLTAIARQEGVALLGRTNLPDGARLVGTISRLPGGPLAFSNTIPVKEGKFSVEIKPRSGEPSPLKAPYRVGVFFDQTLQPGDSQQLDPGRIPENGPLTVYTVMDEIPIVLEDIDVEGPDKLN